MPPSTSSTTPSTTRSQRKRAADDVVMFQGHPLDHDWIVKLFKSGADQKKQSRQAMTMCRDLYRKTLTVGIAQSWALRHPDIAASAIEVLPQRRGYVDNLKASVGSAIPTYERQPLGYLDSDRDAAKECRSYMDEWRERNVPINTFNGKAIEDGQYMVTVLPTDSEMDGRPDFYDTLDDVAWAALSEEEQAKYQKDAHDRRGRYAKFDDKGHKLPNPRWDRNARGQTPDTYAADQKKRADKPTPFERDDAKSTEAHDDAVRRYLLSTDRQATTVRVVSAFDVSPFFQRSTDNKRWDLVAAVERRLVYPEDLQTEYGWKGMGDRTLLPTGYDESRVTGQYGQYYLYIAYLVHTTIEKGGRRCRRPMVAYTVAGQPTYMVGGEQPQDQTVGLIDLYETHGLEGPRWFYSGGMYSDDDNPDYCWSPALWPFFESILTIELNKTAINCAVGANAFAGSWIKPDSKLVELDPTAMVDVDDNLIVPEIPPPGEVATAIGDVFPVASASINQDAWRKYQADIATLDAAMAIDQISSNASTSARSMVVQNTIGMIAKRQVREGNLYSVVRAGELHLETLAAIHREFNVAWPIHTTGEQTVGAEVREAVDHVEFDPKWVGPDNNCKLKANYPEERNLAWIDLVTSGYEAPKPTRSLRDVAKAYGDEDEMRLRMEIAEDALWALPTTLEALQKQVAKDQGNEILQEVIKLREAQQLTKQGAPGFEAGVPNAALNGPGEQRQAGGGGDGIGVPGNADSQLGGIISGGRGTGPQMAEGAAQLAVGQGAGVAA